MRKITTSQVQERIDKLNGEGILTLDVSSYVNVRTKCRFVDIEHGEWWVKPDNVFGGQQHPERWKKRRVLGVDQVLDRVKKKHGEIVDLDISSYVNCYSLAKFIDKDYGEWFAAPSHVISGHGHPKRGIAFRSLKHVVAVNEIVERVTQIHHGELSLDVTSYINTVVPAKFIDVIYGEWWSKPNNVLNGHGHPLRANQKKTRTFAKSIRSFPHVFHWKTSEICYSQSGWEYAILIWLNEKQYDYDWQIPFLTPFKNKKIKRCSIYTIDLHIKDGPFANMFVEIKGRFDSRNQISQRNWEWFHNTHPNSELWMMSKLIELGILNKNGKSKWHNDHTSKTG